MDPQGPHDSFDPPPARLADLLDDAIVWLERRRHLMPRAVVAVVTVAVIVGGGWWMFRPRSTVAIEDRIPMVALEPSIPGAEPGTGVGSTTSTSSVDGPLTVHVAGAVEQAGVYEFIAGDRVVDAVNAAGGALAGADLSAVNLAAPLIDGSQIRIPIEGETPPIPLVPVGGVPPAAGADRSRESAPVLLNQATATDLERLPGVGPATAQSILTWRINNGPFLTVEQLMDVPGIGPAKFAAMVDQVVVG